MNYQDNKKNISEFIDYKIENSYESESKSRAFNLEKKCQKMLNQANEKIESKKLLMDHEFYESKKLKEKVWKQIIQITNLIKNYQGAQYKEEQKIRAFLSAKDQRQRDFEQRKRHKQMRETELLEQKQGIAEQSSYWFEQKQNDMKEMKKKSIEIRQRIAHHEPFVEKYYDCIIKKESLMKKIDEFRSKNQLSVKILWQLSEKYESLQKQKKNKIQQKDKNEKNQIEERKKQINDFISWINGQLRKQILHPDEFKQMKQQFEKKKIQFEQLQKNENQGLISEKQFKMTERFYKIISIMGLSPEMTPLPPSPVRKKSNTFQIIQQVEENQKQAIQEAIKIMNEQLQILQKQEEKIIQKQHELRSEEDLKEKQIKGLNETLEKMKISLQ